MIPFVISFLTGAIYKKQGYDVEDINENADENDETKEKKIVLAMNTGNLAELDYENVSGSNSKTEHQQTSEKHNVIKTYSAPNNESIALSDEGPETTSKDEEPGLENSIEMHDKNLSTSASTPHVRPDLPKAEKPKSVRGPKKTKAKLSPHPSTDSEKVKESEMGTSDKPILIHNSSEDSAVAGIINIPPKSPSPGKPNPTTGEQTSVDVKASSTEVPSRSPRPSARQQEANEVLETRAHPPESPRPSQRKQETSDILETEGPVPKSRQPSQRKQKSNDEENGATASKPPIRIPRKQQSKEVQSDLVKNDDLARQVEELAGNKELLQNEYADIVEFVKQNIKKPRNVAKEEKHKAHNRYTDIGKPSQNYK